MDTTIHRTVVSCEISCQWWRVWRFCLLIALDCEGRCSSSQKLDRQLHHRHSQQVNFCCCFSFVVKSTMQNLVGWVSSAVWGQETYQILHRRPLQGGQKRPCLCFSTVTYFMTMGWENDTGSAWREQNSGWWEFTLVQCPDIREKNQSRGPKIGWAVLLRKKFCAVREPTILNFSLSFWPK
jgi:hypothetical protein